MSLALDTIVAPVTPPGPAGIAILRLSGERTREVLETLSPVAERALFSPRKLVFGGIYQGPWESSEVLDEGLIVFFPAPHSYTGEDVAELHLHGSTFVVSRMLAVLGDLGIRLARPGEFTERAFLGGKIDLSQAEAVGDLILAETELQARVAREQLGGKLSDAVTHLGEPLRLLLAEIEAEIDFPDEDIEPVARTQWVSTMNEVQEVLREYLHSFRTGRICREGALVVLAGLPNAGKSSLLNALLGENRAIVTAKAGTTRDSIEERSAINGLQVRFCDTAGLLEKTGHRQLDEAEKLGIERSWKKLEQADLVLFVLDGSVDEKLQEEVLGEVRTRAAKLVVVCNKEDLVLPERKNHLLALYGPENTVLVSALKKENISAVRDKIFSTLVQSHFQLGSVLVSNQRHFDALEQASRALEDAIKEVQREVPSEFISVLLRAVLGALEGIIGVTPNEEILGLIFSKFCIGK